MAGYLLGSLEAEPSGECRGCEESKINIGGARQTCCFKASVASASSHGSSETENAPQTCCIGGEKAGLLHTASITVGHRPPLVGVVTPQASLD